MLDEYNEEPQKVVLTNKSKSSKFILFEETPTMRGKREQVLALLKKNEGVLKEIEEAMVDYTRARIMAYPQVSPVLVKKAGSQNDSEYYNARVMWPEYDGSQRELRVYLGKKSDFGDFTDAKELHLAQQKISDQLKRRKEMNTLERNEK